MATYRLFLFGREVASLEVEHDDVVPETIGGGGGGQFERDTEPLDPNERYDWPIDRFGFR